MSNEFLEPFARLLADISTSAAIRQAEHSGDTAAVWSSILESGYLDAIVPEEQGGVGLTPADMAPILLATGEHLLPVPFAETMLARALFARAGVSDVPEVPIALFPLGPNRRALSTVAATAASDLHGLVQQGSDFALYPTKAVTAGDGFGIAAATPDLDAAPIARFTSGDVDIFAWGAALTATQMAGALTRVLDLSLAYANERQQFGRPLSKFQAIQHQLSVMAERVVAASVGARLGVGGAGLSIDPWRAATAKCVANDAAVQTLVMAHAVHGAIGVSEEHDLQLYARRIKRWGLSFGSESYWAQKIGAKRAENTAITSVDFVRENLAKAG